VNRSTSVYLDAVRLFAALVVVLTHLGYPRFSGGLLLAFRTYGNDAVMVFFVLSGYVIAYTAATRDRDVGTYGVNRLARLYSVAVPAVFLTWLLDAAGSRLDPALYDGFWYRSSEPFRRVLEALTFTNQLWFHSTRLFSNGPYWSLGYEFWYYAIFAAGWYFSGWKRTALVAACAAIMGPKILLLLPIWLLGAWVYRFNERSRITPAAGAALFVGSIAFYAAFRATGMRDVLLGLTNAWLGEAFVRGKLTWSDEFLSSYVIGTLVAANFIGFHAISERVAPWMARGESVIRSSAGYTFSIYLFHYPLMQFLGAAFQPDPRSPLAIAALFFGTVLTCCALGTFTEKRKDLARSLLRGQLRIRKPAAE